jgi:hypothetical protein
MRLSEQLKQNYTNCTCGVEMEAYHRKAQALEDALYSALCDKGLHQAMKIEDARTFANNRIDDIGS